MKKNILLLFTFIYTSFTIGQNTFKAIIKDYGSKETLFGTTAIVQETTIGTSSNQNGLIEIKNIPNGKQVIIVSYMEYKENLNTFYFPFAQTEKENEK